MEANHLGRAQSRERRHGPPYAGARDLRDRAEPGPHGNHIASCFAGRRTNFGLRGGGEGRLERLELADRGTGARRTVEAAALFVLVGARPYTGWLPDSVARDRWGFVLTGADLEGDDADPRWPLTRPPLPLESSLPGCFAVGDVRHGSVKRVASAVGDGAVVVAQVHEHLGREGGGTEG